LLNVRYSEGRVDNKEIQLTKTEIAALGRNEFKDCWVVVTIFKIHQSSHSQETVSIMNA